VIITFNMYTVASCLTCALYTRVVHENYLIDVAVLGPGNTINCFAT